MSDVLTQATAVVNQTDRQLQADIDALARKLDAAPVHTDGEIIDQVEAHIASLSFYLLTAPASVRETLRERLLDGTLLDNIVMGVDEFAPVFAVDVPPAIRRFSAAGCSIKNTRRRTLPAPAGLMLSRFPLLKLINRYNHPLFLETIRPVAGATNPTGGVIG